MVELQSRGRIARKNYWPSLLKLFSNRLIRWWFFGDKLIVNVFILLLSFLFWSKHLFDSYKIKNDCNDWNEISDNNLFNFKRYLLFLLDFWWFLKRYRISLQFDDYHFKLTSPQIKLFILTYNQRMFNLYQEEKLKFAQLYYQFSSW